MLLGIVNKLQKWICRTVGPSLAAFFEPLAHCRNVTSLNLFYRYYYGRCSSTCYSDRLYYFSVIILRCCKDGCVNSLFLHTLLLWNFLSKGCFSLTSNLNGFKEISCILFVLLFLLTPCIVVTVEPCVKGILIKGNVLKFGLKVWKITKS